VRAQTVHWCVILGLWLAALPATGQESSERLAELRSLRRQAAAKRRRLIFNNDGNEPVYLCRDDVSAEGLLAHRTTPLAGTQVDTIFYCTWSSPFGCFTHNTKVGSLFTADQDGFRNNQTQAFIDRGIDPLKVMVDFGKEHGIEVFWSFRMNDTHDASGAWYGPLMLAASRLKREHPEWLLGRKDARPRIGGWTAVDYGRAEIRELAYRYVEEVCRNYDIDGIELDFLRHSFFFRDHVQGGTATDENRRQMTELVRRIRTMTEAVGVRRGRPILLAVRTHDSPEFCRDVGLDLETWLKEGLIDLWVPSGYFRLRPWRESVELGHRYGVPVYPCLAESRVRGEGRFLRNSVESYRGRAANVWAANADGVYLFNFFNPHAPLWKELGDPQTLRYLEKLYFVTVRDADANSTLVGGARYQSRSPLTPHHPRPITSRQTLTAHLMIADDLPAAAKAGWQARVSLHLNIPQLRNSRQIRTTFNGNALSDGSVRDGWVDYALPAAAVRRGLNKVTVAWQEVPVQKDAWSLVFEGSRRPEKPWRRDRGSQRTSESLEDGALRIADRGKKAGDYLFYRANWGADAEGMSVVEARVKAVSGASYIIVANGRSGERLKIAPDHIALYHHPHTRHAMDTAGDFHTYRIELRGDDIRVFVDGVLRLDGRGRLRPRAGYPRNEIAFGAANSSEVGDAYWKSVKVRTSSLTCHDVVVRVSYGDDRQ